MDSLQLHEVYDQLREIQLDEIITKQSEPFGIQQSVENEADHTVYDADSLPPVYRESKSSKGEPLVTPYLEKSIYWSLTRAELAGARKRRTVRSVKVRIKGRLMEAHHFSDLAGYRHRKTKREAKREDAQG